MHFCCEIVATRGKACRLYETYGLQRVAQDSRTTVVHEVTSETKARYKVRLQRQ